MSGVPRIIGGLVVGWLAAAGALLLLMAVIEPRLLPAAPLVVPVVVFFFAMYTAPAVLGFALPASLLLRARARLSRDGAVALGAATGAVAAGYQRLAWAGSCARSDLAFPFSPCAIMEAWGTGPAGHLLLGAALGLVGGLAFQAVALHR